MNTNVQKELGTFYAVDAMSIILAHALRLEKYGA